MEGVVQLTTVVAEPVVEAVVETPAEPVVEAVAETPAEVATEETPAEKSAE